MASQMNLFRRLTGRPLNIPIAVKLIVIITTILLLANLVVAYQASELFKEVSGKREEDVNRSQADAHVATIDTKIGNLAEKARFLASLLLKSTVQSAGTNQTAVTNSSDRALLDETFKKDRELVSLKVISASTKGMESTGPLINLGYLESYKLDAEYLNLVEQRLKFPVEKVFSGETILENRSLPDGAPLLTLGMPLAKDNLGKITQIVIADIQLQTLQKAFATKSARVEYVVDSRGSVVAHPDDSYVLTRKSLLKTGVVKKAQSSALAKGQVRYYNKSKKEFYRSAFSKAGYGLTVISEAPESIILEPAKQVRIEVIFVTLIVLSIAIFIIFVFSTTLSKPIKNLVGLAKEIARGNFVVSALSIVRSRDEVGMLAQAFDSMVIGLKERDKVKSLFSKFQGSSVTDEILNSEVAAGVGRSLPVAIFFSDLRGFTAISEGLTPEGVVEMLNEYFNAMVKVIDRNSGWVNKYIGDAIMAVWGAPKAGKDDIYSVVNACLEMRLALGELNAKRIARNEAPLMIGMGVHFGEAIAGTIGSDERLEYTVIGDAVNMASRIEASTKAFGTDLLISDAIATRIKDRFILEKAGSAKVKGKSEALTMYKVRGYIVDGRETVIKTPYSDYEAADVEKVEVIA